MVKDTLLDGKWRDRSQARIERQQALVAKLKPGSECHRLAVETFFLLQDSMYALSEAREVIAQAKAAKEP